MKRFFLLLCVICVLYGLSWANFGSSVDGEQAAVTFTHTADCDSARADFGYDGDGGADTLNFYASLQLFPCFSGDGMILMGEGLNLDSIGTHIVKITYFLDDGDATADGYVGGIWTHKSDSVENAITAANKQNFYTWSDAQRDDVIDSLWAILDSIQAGFGSRTPIGDTIQRPASVLTALEIWSENLSGYVTANWAGTFLHGLSDNQDWNQWDNPKTDTSASMGDWFADWFKADYWLTATGFSTHGASDVAALWGDTLTYLIAFRDSVNNAIADANKPNFHSSGDTIGREASTFDPATDNVAVVDSVTGVGRVDSVRKVYYLDSLDQEVSASVSQSDKEDIAEVVKDTAEAHPEIWTDQASGTGADTFNIYVFDADTTAVEGVSITIYNKAHTAVAAPSLITDVNGLTTTFQDADTFHLYLQRLGVIYAQWDTIVVSNQGIDTIWVTAYDPGVSPSPSLTCIQGYNGDVGGNTDDRLTITLRPVYGNLIDTSTGIFIIHKQHYAYSDTGFFEIYVTPSTNLVSKQATGDVDSVRYDLIVYKGYIKQFEQRNIFVPIDAGCIWLKNILD